MKQLLIIRHAKSDWGDHNTRDFDRPLNKRGHTDARDMSNRLLKKNIIPQLVVASSSLRTHTTANYFLETLGLSEKDLILEKSIYESRVSNLLEVVNNLNNDHNLVAVIGHNPGVANLITYLTGSEMLEIPTCAMGLIEFPFNSWAMASAGTGTLKWFEYPKD